MDEPSSASPFRIGAPVQKSRGVTAADVERAADALLRAGERPTVEKIRAQLGSGSPNTVTPLLDAWWKRLSGRLDAGPAALHRLPEVVVHVAEALWLQALQAARERVDQERGAERKKLEDATRGIEVKSYVLTLREGEIEERLSEGQKTIRELRARVQESTTELSKEREARGRHELRSSAARAGKRTARASPKPRKAMKAQERTPARSSSARAIPRIPNGRKRR